MSLRAIAENATRTGFKVAGDIPVTCSVTRTTGQTYDPVTDTYTGGTATDYEFEGIMSTDTRQFREGSTVQAGDMRLMVRQAEVEITPELGETVTVDGTDWQIVNYMQDAAGATYRMQVRR
jgi:hypothetical protein